MITWSVGFMFCNRVRLSLPTHPFTCLLNFWKLNTKSYYARGGNECPVRILSVRPSNFISQNCFSGILHLDIGPIVNVQWVGPNLHARPYLKVITSLNLYSQDLFSVSRKCTSLATFFFFLLSPLLSSKPTSLARIFNRVKNGTARRKDLQSPTSVTQIQKFC